MATSFDDTLLIRISDYSCEPMAKKGDILIARPTAKLLTAFGYYVVKVLLSGVIIVCKPRYVSEEDRYNLEFANSVYQPLFVRREEFEVRGLIIKAPIVERLSIYGTNLGLLKAAV